MDGARYVPDDTAGLVLPLITLIVLGLFLASMFYLLIVSNFETERVAATFSCPIGQCATDLLSGAKRCPTEDGTIPYDPALEVCNEKYACSNVVTPYSLRSDGSTDSSGLCETNVVCPCLRTFRCADYVTSTFDTSEGDPYSSLTNQRITFPQNIIKDGAPINPFLSFCSVPMSFLPFSTPGCNFLDGTNDVSVSDVVRCMGYGRGCDGINNNACKEGVLAFIADSSLPPSQYREVACVKGTACPCGQATVYDTRSGSISCKNV